MYTSTIQLFVTFFFQQQRLFPHPLGLHWKKTSTHFHPTPLFGPLTLFVKFNKIISNPHLETWKMKHCETISMQGPLGPIILFSKSQVFFLQSQWGLCSVHGTKLGFQTKLKNLEFEKYAKIKMQHLKIWRTKLKFAPKKPTKKVFKCQHWDWRFS